MIEANPPKYDFTALGMLKMTFLHILEEFYGIEKISAYAAIEGDKYGIHFAFDDDASAEDHERLETFFDQIKPLEHVAPSGTFFVTHEFKGIRTCDLHDFMFVLESLSEAFGLQFERDVSKIAVVETKTDVDVKRMTAEGLKTLLHRPDLILGLEKTMYGSLTEVARDVMASNSLECPRPPYSFPDLKRAIATENLRTGRESGFEGPKFYFN